MMGAISKASCAVFWFVWMMTLSFLCGVLQIQNKYSYIETKSEMSLLIVFSCVWTIVMAILGCCCIKMEVQHTCCAIWYIIPTLLINLFLCTSVLISLRSSGTESIHEEGDALRQIRKALAATQAVPKFLYQTQLHYGCCGIYGFKDYRAFLIPATTRQDIPYSCCKDPTIGKTRRCPPADKTENFTSTVFDIYINSTIPNVTLPYDIPSDKDDHLLEPIILKLYGTVEEHGNAPERYLSPDLDLPVKVNKLANFHLQGCFEHLKENSKAIHNYYFAFSLFLIASSVLMCILFGKSWVSARRAHHHNIQRLMHDTMRRHSETSIANAEMGRDGKDRLNDSFLREVNASEEKLRPVRLK